MAGLAEKCEQCGVEADCCASRRLAWLLGSVMSRAVCNASCGLNFFDYAICMMPIAMRARWRKCRRRRVAGTYWL